MCYWWGYIRGECYKNDIINEEFETLKLSLQNINELADIKRNPVVESVLMPIIKAFPVIGDMIDSAINVGIDEFQDKKEQELVEIILKDKYTITSEMVNDIEFIVNYARTKEAVRRLATNDKVKFFGNLIRNGYLSGEHIENDTFEEYLEVLTTMSYRQLECLAEFYQKSQSTEGRIIDKDWELFKKNSKYPETDIKFILKQLTRTGFIKECRGVISFDGDDMDGELLADIDGSFLGYELDESIMKFYDMVLKMGD